MTILEETIKTHGPLPVSRYMSLCLAHPTFGYYTTRTVFGKRGDFVTSPEISQVFGEVSLILRCRRTLSPPPSHADSFAPPSQLLAIWYVTQWAQQGSPQKVRIVELGPGRGTLVSDILRVSASRHDRSCLSLTLRRRAAQTFRSLPKSSSPPVSSIHLVENSPGLRDIQKEALANAGFRDTKTEWWGSVGEVPKSEDEFTIVIAHEFFDAMPVHIFEVRCLPTPALVLC